MTFVMLTTREISLNRQTRSPMIFVMVKSGEISLPTSSSLGYTLMRKHTLPKG